MCRKKYGYNPLHTNIPLRLHANSLKEHNAEYQIFCLYTTMADRYTTVQYMFVSLTTTRRSPLHLSSSHSIALLYYPVHRSHQSPKFPSPGLSFTLAWLSKYFSSCFWYSLIPLLRGLPLAWFIWLFEYKTGQTFYTRCL